MVGLFLFLDYDDKYAISQQNEQSTVS